MPKSEKNITHNLNNDKICLPHHQQNDLCTTRLPYRQGRKLTAVKVYSINNESNHLLVFGVPSLNLRQETKALFLKFGKLLHFNISSNHPAEPFTDTYHAMYEKIQSARLAKHMLDTKNFYGGSLHICYAPELESIEETHTKLLQRQKDVLSRLRNLQKESDKQKTKAEILSDDNVSQEKIVKKLNMGEMNSIDLGNDFKSASTSKRKVSQNVIVKKFKPCFEETKVDKFRTQTVSTPIQRGTTIDSSAVEVVDCTSTEIETITNINESLNYNKFGNEVIHKVPVKPINRIKFSFGNKLNET